MKNLKIARVNKNYTQQKLANLCNISLPTYSRYETGTSSPDLKTVLKLAKILDTSPAFIAGFTDDYDYIPTQIDHDNQLIKEDWKSKFIKNFDFISSTYPYYLRYVFTKIPYGIPLNSIDNKFINEDQQILEFNSNYFDKDHDIFAFTYQENNMVPYIKKNCIIVARTNTSFENNDLVVVHIHHNDATVRQIKKINGKIYLSTPERENIPFEISEDNSIEIAGVIIRIIENLKPINYFKEF